MFTITKDTPIRDIMALPSVASFSKYFLKGTNEASLALPDRTPGSFGTGCDAVIRGFDRLLELMDNGGECIPLYDDVSDDPDKAEVNLIPFPAPADKKLPGKPYVLVVPGGGWVNVWSVTEGYPIAAYLNERGYDAFVLTYRIAKEDLLPAPLDDMARAIRFIDDNAERFHVTKGSYVVTGFSAGGSLTAAWGTEQVGWAKYGMAAPKAVWPIYAPSTLRYIGEGTPGHEGDLAVFTTGKKDGPRLGVYAQAPFTAKYPPAFIACCRDDGLVNWHHSEYIAQCLEKAGVPHVLEVGAKGDHGFGDGSNTAEEGWIDRAIAFTDHF